MAKIAGDTSKGRESLYKSLSEGGNLSGRSTLSG
jgi:DNA-binding phage protein